MKKINLFNRNTNSPSYRRRGLPFPWERGPAEQPGGMGITPSCSQCSQSTPSWKEGEHKVPSYRRRPVSRGFNRGGGIPLFSGAVIFALFIATPSFATPTELDKKTVASKAYVDTKQDKIETGLVEFEGDDATINVPSVVTTNVAGTGLSGNQIGFMTLSALNSTATPFGDFADGNNGDNFVPSAALVASKLEELSTSVWNAMPSSWNAFTWNNDTFPAAINAYSTTFDTTSIHANGNWPRNQRGYLVRADTFANSLALKQNKIPAAEEDYQSVLTDTDEDGVIGKRAILDWQTFDSNFGPTDLYSDPMLANMIPEVKVVGDLTRRLSWESTNTTAINAYNTTFGTGTSNWAGNNRDLISGQFLANSLALKQNILPARFTSETNTTQMRAMGGETIELAGGPGYVYHRYITAGGNEPLTIRSGADNTILYVNGTKTVEQFQTSNFGGTGDVATTNQNYIKGALVSLELLKDVYSELNSKITNNALPTGTTGTVVTYNGVNAETGVQEFTETAISGTATYDDNDQLTNGNNIANVSLVETEIATRQKKRTCAGYEPGHENEADYCWLWDFPDD